MQGAGAPSASPVEAAPAGAARARALLLRLLPLALFLLALVPFLPALRAGFVDWDDTQNVVENQGWRGFDAAHLRWMFATSFFGHWQPLTWLSYAADHALWGMDPRGYHLTSLLLHGLDAALAFLVLREVLERGRGRSGTRLTLAAAAGALFFAVHPLRVESVAWVTERRDVLSGVFWLATILLYLRAHRPGASRAARRGLSALALLALALSLLAKAWGITMPAVLLLLDVWPLRRLGKERGARERALVLVEKLPYAMLAGGAALAAAAAQREVAAAVSLADYGALARAAQALYGLTFYARRTVLPLHLSPLYTLPPELHLTEPRILLSAAFVLAVTLVLALRRAWRPLLVGWLIYAVVVSPVLGFLQSGSQMVADRYSYLACLPFAAFVAAGLDALANRLGSTGARRALAAAALLVLAGYGLAAERQTRIWHDSVTLWEHALALDPGSFIAHYDLGTELQESGDLPGAIEHFRAAVALRPGMGQYHQALGVALRASGDLAGAKQSLERALVNGADTPETREAMATTLIDLGDPADALPHLLHALDTSPGSAALHQDAALCYQAMKLEDRALEEAEKAVRLDPRSAPAHNLFGALLASKGRADEAIAQCREAIRLAPTLADAHYNLGLIADQKGDERAAAEAFREGLALEPRLRVANRLAWILATSPTADVRNGPEALRWARWVDQHTEEPRSRFLATLAAAQAETGDFPAAQSTIDRAITLAGSDPSRGLLEARALYRAEKPLHRGG